MSNIDFKSSILRWINTFNVSVYSLNGLVDGVDLAYILHEIDQESFDATIVQPNVAGNWVLCATNLRKLGREIEGFFINTLHRDPQIETIDFNLIAKGDDNDEILKLLELILVIAVSCENRNVHIQNIMRLPDEVQVGLMPIIQTKLSELPEIRQASGSFEQNEVEIDFSDSVSKSEHTKLQKEYKSIVEKLNESENNFKLLLRENETLKNQLQDIPSHNRWHSDETVDKDLKLQVEQLTDQLNIAEGQSKLLAAQNSELRQEIKSNEFKNQELNGLIKDMKEELEILRSKNLIYEQGQKQLEGYREKLENVEKLKSTIKSLQTTNKELENQLAEAEQYSRNVQQFKNLNDELKNELKSSQAEANRLQAELNSADKELTRLRVEKDEIDKDRKAQLSKVSLLEQELQILRKEKDEDSDDLSVLEQMKWASQTNQTIQQEKVQSDVDITVFQLKIDELEKIKSQNESEIITLQNEKKQLEEKFLELSNIFKKYEEENQILRENVKKLKNYIQKTLKLTQEKFATIYASRDQSQQNNKEHLKTETKDRNAKNNSQEMFSLISSTDESNEIQV